MPQDHREKKVSDTSPSPQHSSNSTEAGPRNDNYYDDDEENQELDFDMLMGDAIQCEAEFDEDRDDQFDDDDEDS